MNEFYFEVEYSVRGAHDLNAEQETLLQALFQLELASQQVFDTDCAVNFETNSVVICTYGRADTTEAATTAVMALIDAGLKQSAAVDWAWQSTTVRNASIDADQQLLTSAR